MKLGLGTAQFGLDYGISNRRGKVSLAEGKKILQMAREADVAVIDTAPGYGDSQAALGELLQKDHPFRLVTKTLPVNEKTVNELTIARIEESFKDSLSKLRTKSVYGLLIHHAEDILLPGGQLLAHKLQELKRDRFVQKIGVSVYSGKQIDLVLDLFQPDIVQLPLNVFDQRLIESGHLARLHKLGIEIHARSIFLQGLLLMDPKGLNPFFSGVENHFGRYREFIAQQGLSPLEMAVQFIMEHSEIDTALVGVSAATEFEEIVKACTKRRPTAHPWQSFAIHDENILNPSLWRLKGGTHV